MSANNSEPVSIILRFRDLVTNPGDTIVKHQMIADKHGKVWWGWWAKSGEDVPDDVFRAQSSAVPREIYLFDSGHCQLWSAMLHRITWDVQHEPITTPNPEYTPEYYHTQTSLAWFQLVEIMSIPEPAEFLKKFSYVKVDEFFGDKQSRYGAFYDKQVSSPEELRQQDRSVWFVRPRTDDGPTHMVSLLSERRVEPNHFPREYELSKSWNLLWVSDLHFSESGEHGFPTDNNSPSQHTLGNALEDALRSAQIDNLGGVLLTGDLTWRGTSKEFELAQNFVSRMLTPRTDAPHRADRVHAG